jgi:transposase, IS30 family
MMGYKQLTHEQRYHIYALRKAGKTLAQIAKELKRDKSTISRELRRNKGRRGYQPNRAHEKSTCRRLTARKHVKLDQTLIAMIVEKIKEDWSPEQISGTFKKNKVANISTKSIYSLISLDKNNGGKLHTHLRRSNKKRKKKYGSKDARGQIINRVSIDQRPKIVDRKIRVGDWELDTIIGKYHKGAIITVVERKSKFVLIKKVKSKNSKIVERALVAMLRPFKKKVHTLTSDNGKEFAGHENVASTGLL